MDRSISIIVPAFNEEKNIKGTLETLLKAKDNIKNVCELIVVNDGSYDKTSQILKEFKQSVKRVEFSENKGKGAALAAGIKKAKGDLVMFIDADLIGLKEKHVEMLARQMDGKRVDAVIGVKKGAWYEKNPIFKYFAGERIYRRNDLLPHIGEMQDKRFGIEMFLNGLFINGKVIYIDFNDLTHHLKHKKYNLQDAGKQLLNGLKDPLAEISKNPDFTKSEIKKILKLK